MRWRVLFFASLGVNLLIAVLWLVQLRRPDPSPDEAADTASSNLTVKTNVIVRRQFFAWSQIESDDYPTYITNLREIGCPEQTIRDIIIADVNGLYARRLATDSDVTAPGQQWWRAEPDTNLVRVANEKIRAINDERRGMLARLLGPNWEGGDLANLPRPSRPGIVLDGPLLGMLSMETKQAVEEISLRAEDRLQAYLDAQRQLGRPPDPVELAKLRQQTRTDLAGVLTPSQLEEYLLRYSQNAINLRTEVGQLKYFNATPEEFRTLFRATDAIDQQLELLAGSTDPNVVLQRNVLLQQRETALKNALPPDRYEQYAALRDPVYRDAVAMAQDLGTPDAARTIYAINMTAAQQETTLRANTNLTPAQLAVELKRLELEQLKATAVALGEEVPEEATTLPATTPSPPPLPVRTHPYVVGIAESAGNIASRYGISLRSLQEANPNLNLNRIRSGDTLRVPYATPGTR